MVPDDQGQPPPVDPDSAAAIARLADRVAALEQQVAALRSAPIISISAAAPPLLPKPRPNRTPNRSLEDRLGAQVFNRIGILALLIGVAWALKLAIDRHYLGPVGRVLIGLVAGSAIILWSERFRRSGFPAFSFSLKAVGSGVLYLTLWAAFQLYGLLPASAALLAMVLVTAWNAWMAWAQDAELLAAYALAGGLATPHLLSTNGNHAAFLFSYLFALDLATVLLVRLKPWPRLLLAAWPLTAAYFLTWYLDFHRSTPLPLILAFLSVFFLLFATPALTPREPHPSSRLSLIPNLLLPLANAAGTALAAYLLLNDAGHHALTPWLMLLLSAIYLGLTRLPQAPIAFAAHLSLAVVFLSIAIPLELDGRSITIAWLIEGVTLLALTVRLSRTQAAPTTTLRPLRTLALAALTLGWLAVLWDINFLPPGSIAAFFNARFATALVALVTFALATWLCLHAQPGSTTPTFPQIAAASTIAFNLTAILSTIREIVTLWPAFGHDPESDLRQSLAISAFLMLYGAILLAAGFWRRSAFVRWQALALLVFSIAKTFLYDLRHLSQGYRVVSFLALGALLLAISFAYQKDWLALRQSPAQPTSPPAPAELHP